MKEAALRANMTKTELVQGGQDHQAASMAMEKDLNSTAMENFKALLDDVKDKHKEMSDQMEQLIASTSSGVGSKIQELQDRITSAKSAVDSYTAKRKQYE